MIRSVFEKLTFFRSSRRPVSFQGTIGSSPWSQKSATGSYLISAQFSSHTGGACGIEVKNEWRFTTTPPFVLMALVSYSLQRVSPKWFLSLRCSKNFGFISHFLLYLITNCGGRVKHMKLVFMYFSPCLCYFVSLR